MLVLFFLPCGAGLLSILQANIGPVGCILCSEGPRRSSILVKFMFTSYHVSRQLLYTLLI